VVRTSTATAIMYTIQSSCMSWPCRSGRLWRGAATHPATQTGAAVHYLMEVLCYSICCTAAHGTTVQVDCGSAGQLLCQWLTYPLLLLLLPVPSGTKLAAAAAAAACSPWYRHTCGPCLPLGTSANQVSPLVQPTDCWRHGWICTPLCSVAVDEPPGVLRQSPHLSHAAIQWCRQELHAIALTAPFLPDSSSVATPAQQATPTNDRRHGVSCTHFTHT
jgi:hypothetical protein